MQTLQFESAWDKTISLQDREKINTTFARTKKLNEEGIELIFLWEARNHKGNLLITTLIHNFNNESFQLHRSAIAYQRNQHTMATGLFDINKVIEGKTTMPWTFIFSYENQTKRVPNYIIKKRKHSC